MRMLCCLIPCLLAVPCRADDAAIRKAVSLYASFDERPEADFGGGDLQLWTRTEDSKAKGRFHHAKGVNADVFTINKTKGAHGGCLDVGNVLPENGRIYFPAKGNIGFNKDGWGGAVSVWLNTNPNELLKTKFCDPIQITQKGFNNGGIWFDFNDAKPRDLRHGAFTAVAENEKPPVEGAVEAQLVWLKRVPFKQGEWRHVVLSWKNFDTSKNDAVSQLWVDGKLIGDIKDRGIAMKWDMEKAGIYVAINYIGLLDELAVFNRPLAEAEIGELQKNPGLLAPLKAKPRP
jgi:hypothetical protein